MSIIRKIDVHPVSFRLLRPFITAQGKKSETANVQVAVELANGIRGYGEASSSIAMPLQSQDVMTRIIKELARDLRGQDIQDYVALIHTCWRRQPYHPTAVGAIECALFDAFTKLQKQSLYKFLGGEQTTIETDLTISIGDSFAVSQAVRKGRQRGFRRFKIKLAGDTPQKDAARLQAAHRAMPTAPLVADGNQGMNMSQAIELVALLERMHVPLVFLEQPFPKHDLPSMRTFRKKCKIPLIADESVLTAADAIKVFEANAADGVNIKIAKSGLLGALDIIKTAKRYKKMLAIGCMEESKLGLAASVHLACGTGAFAWIDLDSAFLLEPSPLRGGFRSRGAKLSVAGMGPGLGIR